MAGRALVLGGGGVTGVAWELGVLAGLAYAGIDLAAADVIIGTSAGSVVAAQLTSGTDLEKLYAAQLLGAGDEIPARISAATMLKWVLAFAGGRDARQGRARVGRMALAARTVPESERRRVIAARLPVHQWPARRLLITAVDAATGEFAVFAADSGVSLVDAVGASCAVPGVWPPVTIDGRRYIDGGVRSAANVDLADGYERVVVLAPTTGGAGPVPRVATQVARLTATTAVRNAAVKTVVVSPDKRAKQAIGRNVLDPARRAPAARAGREQAAAVATAVADVWHL
ncbi:patatin-like phospholipase family protein [Planosporangium thailandense]|uniref:Patatin-like phospholipase family protein n=1 Tax=Planosporangium thailandense TaxID=765197 RepID=A0ABX0Y6T0_9ACTN|nr:patatin-like phospholipase family protein [Planosporangium thailandense]NJC74117.1 patatin-like phospholipase family protein [Planosporangium thailandense]